MLVLTRRLDESLIIGETITVKILAIDGDKVKLGIEAPREISIFRNEVYQAVMEQNQLANLLASAPEPESFQVLRQLLSSSSDPPDEKSDPKKDE